MPTCSSAANLLTELYILIPWSVGYWLQRHCYACHSVPAAAASAARSVNITLCSQRHRAPLAAPPVVVLLQLSAIFPLWQTPGFSDSSGSWPHHRTSQLPLQFINRTLDDVCLYTFPSRPRLHLLSEPFDTVFQLARLWIQPALSCSAETSQTTIIYVVQHHCYVHSTLPWHAELLGFSNCRS